MKLRHGLPPISADDILCFEKSADLLLPKEYKAFLVNHNGGQPEDDLHVDVTGFQTIVLNSIYGIGEKKQGAVGTVNRYCDIFEDRIPSGFVPIGDNGSGDQLLLATQKSGAEGVYFFDHENEPEDTDGLAWEEYGNIYKIANSFSEFLEKLK